MTFSCRKIVIIRFSFYWIISQLFNAFWFGNHRKYWTYFWSILWKLIRLPANNFHSVSFRCSVSIYLSRSLRAARFLATFISFESTTVMSTTTCYMHRYPLSHVHHVRRLRRVPQSSLWTRSHMELSHYLCGYSFDFQKIVAATFKQNLT